MQDDFLWKLFKLFLDWIDISRVLMSSSSFALRLPSSHSQTGPVSWPRGHGSLLKQPYQRDCPERPVKMKVVLILLYIMWKYIYPQYFLYLLVIVFDLVNMKYNQFRNVYVILWVYDLCDYYFLNVASSYICYSMHYFSWKKNRKLPEVLMLSWYMIFFQSPWQNFYHCLQSINILKQLVT